MSHLGATRVARSRMQMRALVQEDTATGRDALNQPLPEVWATHIRALPCHVWTPSKDFISDDNKNALREVLRMICPKGTDISEAHRIQNVTNRQGTVLFSGTFIIDTMQEKPTHIELTLRQID